MKWDPKIRAASLGDPAAETACPDQAECQHEGVGAALIVNGAETTLPGKVVSATLTEKWVFWRSVFRSTVFFFFFGWGVFREMGPG